jgi:hypothetical protein
VYSILEYTCAMSCSSRQLCKLPPAARNVPLCNAVQLCRLLSELLAPSCEHTTPLLHRQTADPAAPNRRFTRACLLRCGLQSARALAGVMPTVKSIQCHLTPWSRVLLQKLTVNFAASQEIPRIYVTRNFLTVPTSASHLSLS